jgi:uncharacterized protein (DUF488 family)
VSAPAADSAPRKCFSVGYGGRKPKEFLALLTRAGVRTVVDVRLRPDKASVSAYSQSKDPAKGLQGLLREGGIRYVPLLELGNLFMEHPDWKARYAEMFERAGETLVQRLYESERIVAPFALLCAEQDASECHRQFIGAFLRSRGWAVEELR